MENTIIGQSYDDHFLDGKISEVRMSDTNLYTEDFTPNSQLGYNDHTISYYAFNAGEGNILFDSWNKNGSFHLITQASQNFFGRLNHIIKVLFC